MITQKARLFRFPIDLRGKRHINFGTGLTTGVGCRFEAFGEGDRKTLTFGNNVQVNDYVHICAMESVVLGDHVLIAGKVYISDNSHGDYSVASKDSSPDTSPIKRPYFISPVVIEGNVWIGENVIVMPGTCIGRGSIIGANSVVKGEIPAGCMVVGAPARIVKRYNSQTLKWEKNI